ncbi:acyl-CoA thioesterase [Bacterioplanoides sp.]|uniref:acyl-CoA thioesterase n=1 Tax=Bacterioplanoides sp. TaxID=2066072 RepID=UPI003B5BA9CB
MSKITEKRDNYQVFMPVTSRWLDNDAYGHLNNMVYYGYFDSAINSYLIQQGGLDIQHSDAIGYVVSSGCDYYSPLAFPDAIEVGIRVAHLGNSSVRYELAMFRQGEDVPAACGFFVHVFVDRASDKPTPIPNHTRDVLQALMSDHSADEANHAE